MCGIFGVIGHKDAARLTYLGLYALQHRGEESAGILVSNGKKVIQHKAMGLVSDVFHEDVLRTLHGNLAIGHVRYSTTGSSNPKNIQPFLINHKQAHIAIAHNGNLVNAHILRRQMEDKGAIFQTSMDSEVIAHLFTHLIKDDPQQAVIQSLAQLQGAFSLVMTFNNTLIGARDTYGWRPLCLGMLEGAYVLASETCALDLIGAKYIRDIEPGEVVFIHEGKLDSVMPFPKTRYSFCIFEYIYFARPDSNIFGHSVYKTRKNLGEQLGKEFPVQADLVIPVPDSGTCAAIGAAKALELPFEMGLIRNHYIGRTFIQPSQASRDFRVRVKLNPVKEVLKEKRVVIVEDSIVRGTTSRARVKTIRDSGAKEVHMRVSCPPLKYPCFYGIDFPTRKELIAAKHTIEWIRDFIGVDNLAYLSLEGMLKSMPLPKENFCTACFTGNYPANCPKKLCKHILER